MSRAYSDPSYGSKKVIALGNGVALNGTVTSTTAKAAFTAMHPIRITDWNVAVVVAGTAVDTNLILCKSAAGTGALSAVGTITLTGTKTAASVIDGSLTATSFDTGDDVVLARAAGTETEATIRVNAFVQYQEAFQTGDN
jgi:hypothetical protein